MNNIRKIIEERLENARNDFLNALNNGKATDREIGELQYTVTTYQDCLNLIPAPRTEQDILNDFEILDNDNVILRLKKNKIYIEILKQEKAYRVFMIIKGNERSAFLSVQEHKLLNELFEVIFDE